MTHSEQQHCSKITDSETTRANFPFFMLPREPGLPDHQRINEVHSKGNDNASSISSELGAGYGLMGLTILDVTYQIITGNFLVQPLNSGLLLINVADMSAQMAEQLR